MEKKVLPYQSGLTAGYSDWIWEIRFLLSSAQDAGVTWSMLSRSGSKLTRRQHSGPPRPDSGDTCRAFTVSCHRGHKAVSIFYHFYKHLIVFILLDVRQTVSISVSSIKDLLSASSCLPDISPCWSELGGACSRLCRGRGIC